MSEVNELVKSPCISVCFLNDEDICEGCYRSAEEITNWSTLDNPQRKAVIVKARERFHGGDKSGLK